MRNAAVTASPNHRPGLLRNLPKVSCIPGSIGILPVAIAMASEPPDNRYTSMVPKCEVLNTIFSSAQITITGRAAQKCGSSRPT